MPAITKPITREIIEDFAREIRQKRLATAKPPKTVINFRTDQQDGIERQIWRVPVDLLRFRKENGRICSDVLDYERNTAILRETEETTQTTIADFLERKDPEKTRDLRASVIHAGQLEPAIITCDGFLINGNRRKMVMDKLHAEYPNDPTFKYMKCVILPSKDDDGGPPTLLEIEKLENRYQLQSDGRSEYYGFDRALSINRKIALGLSLEEQLRDDPRYVDASKADLDKAVKEHERLYLRPLECADRYLAQFNREGQYRTVSSGISDPKGRWQALVDYSQMYTQYFLNPKKRIELAIEEDEIGSIEEAAFDIIRLRTVPEMPKVHKIMRDLPKYCRTSDGKKEILRIVEKVEPVLPPTDCRDAKGNHLSSAEVDVKWATKYGQPIIYHLKKAASKHEAQKEKETPLGLLEAAYKKLTHDNMDLAAIAASELKNARELIIKIRERSDELEQQVYHFEKGLKKLLAKKK